MKLAPTPIAFRGRLLFLIVLMGVGFLVVLAGYYRMQVLNRERYEALGEKYRFKTMPIKARRGYIYDRNGTLLAQNMPTYNLVLRRDEMEESWRRLLPRLAGFLSIDQGTLKERFRGGSIYLSKPVILKENISYEESLRIKRQQRRFPGLAIETAKKRTYNDGELFTHVLGYVAEASKRDLERNKNLKMGDMIGKSGVEIAYNDLLTGDDGTMKIQIDNRGVYRQTETTIEAIPGNDLYLTLDHDLQQLAREAIEERGGSVVMMDVETGELLVYLSSPTFDLNWFTQGFPAKKWAELQKSRNSPFLNRPVQGAYAPGSVFKMVTALAALKHHKVDPSTKYFCNGQYDFNGHISKCHKEEGHGWVDLRESIQYSCNVFYYNVARDLDIDQLAKVARDLGFGQKTGIDLIGENGGHMPDRAWKRRRYHQIWYPGETLSVAIGQGALLATPLQLVRLMAGLARDGDMPTPHLLLKSGNEGNYDSYSNSSHLADLPKENYRFIREAMWRVVNRDRGTGSAARIDDFEVCGKTGTAQLKNFKKDEDDDEKERDYLNAWFAGFAPYKQPKVAIIVLVEHAGHGGHMAAPIAKKLLTAYRDKYHIKVDPT